MPVHRPLFSVDKPEIVERAKVLGTFEDAGISAGCNRLAPDKPETKGRLEGLLKVEPDDIFERARADAADAERVDI
jgi:thiamine biosynthesis protein ThiI